MAMTAGPVLMLTEQRDFSLGQAAFGTVEHNLHRMRWAPVAKLFSRPTTSQLESKVTAPELAQVLCDKMLARTGQRDPFDPVSPLPIAT